jgi:uncharacterized protein (TIGR02996 family)
MEEREALLRGVFLNPADPLPKLVFADFVEERGEEAWAEVLRLSCELAKLPPADVPGRGAVRAEMFNRIRDGGLKHAECDTGFRECRCIHAPADLLMDFDKFRRVSVTDHPEWFGARELKVTHGPLTTREPLVTILTAPATQNVMHFDFSGVVVEIAADEPPQADETLNFYDLQQHPLITTKMVETLVGMRECRRIVRLDLRNNGLGNDAVRAITASPHLQRLKYLLLKDGNDFNGRTWGRVQERYGEEVVY